MRREFGVRPGIDFKYLPEDFGENLSDNVIDGLLLAMDIHQNDRRKVGGEPYLHHCIAVASILEKWGADEEEIIAGLLHDTVEDHPDLISIEKIKKKFGERVARLVDGVTKLNSGGEDPGEFETMKKVTKEGLIELAVVLIKLADRLHNMLQQEGMKPESQIRNSRQTLSVYAPLAESFGLWQVKKLLEDLSFRYTDPKRYSQVKAAVDADPRLNPAYIDNMEVEIALELIMHGIEATVEHQIGGLFEIAEKQKRFGMRADVRTNSFSELTDLISFRVILQDESDLALCYKAMGVIRNKFKGKLIREWHNDYLVQPATNGYSCIHDSFHFDEGNVEIAFTTVEREKFNNWGVASMDKEKLAKNPERYARKLIFTPKQELVFMKPSATGIDVAYKLNPLLGLRTVGIRIDGQVSRLDQIVPHASLVEIMVDPNQLSPSEEWLLYCNRETRKMIEQQQAVVERDMEVQKGKEILSEAVLKERGILNLSDLNGRQVDRLLMALGCWNGLTDLYYKVSYGLDPELIKTKMDELGIMKGTYSTVQVIGENRIGVSRDVSEIVAKNGGDARSKVEKVDDKEHFVIRMLITVDEAGKKEIERELKEKYPGSIVA